MSVPKLELVALTKEFDSGSVAAVDCVDLSVEAGETMALLGPSGCGKSTLLNMIAGLQEPTSGDILIDRHPVTGVPAGKRRVGLVFQDYAVFTHMTVAKNLSFGLEVRGVPKEVIERAVAEVAELLDMRDQLSARASDLGGSQLQRVAIGRTLVTKPEILLLDEPLSNLEASARLAMRRELRRLQHEIGLTIVYVTHDQIEALSLADRIAVMSNGKIRQVARTADIFDRPDHTFVASFLGSPPMNLLRGKLTRHGTDSTFANARLRLVFPGTQVLASDENVGVEVVLGVRPESMHLVDADKATWLGRVALVELRGAEAIITIEIEGQLLKVVTPAIGRPDEGANVGLSVLPENCILFNSDTGRRMAA